MGFGEFVCLASLVEPMESISFVNDGDRLFTSFNGSLYEGENIIIGGTGKYSGMTGSGPWACEDLGNNGSSRCWQTINYNK